MIGIDGEWGLAMRLDSTMKFPKQITLGALQNDTLIYIMGREIGRECRRMGIHINFAPVLDINSNANNPVINFRSFGENKNQVARKSFAYMLGLQDEFILACGKHFPGHGDTDADSHLTLPTVNRNKKTLDSIDIAPFKFLIRSGLAGVMVAHLNVPVLTGQDKIPTTLSRKVVTQLLQKDLGFKGLIFTDALNMKGVSSFYEPGEVDLKALQAGNDILLFPEDVPKAIERIENAIAKKQISIGEIDAHCRKILLAKKWVGADKKAISTSELMADLNSPYAQMINQKLFENAVTVLENKGNILPFKRLDTLKIAVISVGDSTGNIFQQRCEKYASIDAFSVSDEPKGAEIGNLLRQTRGHNLFVFALNGTTNSPAKNFGVSQAAISLINEYNLNHKVIVAYFGNPYGLKYFPGASLLDGLVMCYENHPVAKDVAAQFIFGGVSGNGLLPVTVSRYFKYDDGLCVEGGVRFKYCLPEDLGIRSEWLHKIDSLAITGITEKAYPGCQILIAKKGKIFYEKSFGYFTYDSVRPVTNNAIYDLASVTKIASTVATVMKLQDEGKFSLNWTLHDLLPDIVDSTEYADISLRDMLSHQARLTPWIPFYINTLSKGKLKPEIYRTTPSDSFSVRVADHLYILNSYRDSIYKTIIKTPLLKQKKYLYSDVGYYFLLEYIQRVTHTSLNHFVDSVFYHPLGATTLGYLPRERFSLDRIPPEEDDKVFRKQLIHGDVHDQGAAMMGGVGGHAGLFSSANDLAKMMQMLMNYGIYGGERYLNAKTVLEFTSCQNCPENRRGAGFDRPTLQDNLGPTCNCVSAESFGHTGFTGITAWADPGEDVIYIFMSNRSFPVGDNPKILRMGIRTDIQQEIYHALRRK